jgi:coenzyme F420 biosynthesis associated uncharacterized protein
MVDWSLAERIADTVAGGGDAPRAEPLPGDLAAMAERSREAVVAYARLRPATPIPSLEAVGRATWARANLVTMRTTLAPMLDRLDASGPVRGPFGAPLRAAGGTLVAAEIGGLVGLMSRRVLGQYELALLDVTAPARLLLVAPNLTAAAAEMKAEPEELLSWVVIHEVTHAIQFTGVPWLREYLGGLLAELLSSVDLKIDPAALLRLPKREDLTGLWEAVREGGLVTAVAGPERRAVLDRVQATMALVEGHAEHVMDAAGAPLLPSLPSLRAALDRRRRERPPLAKLLERLLGLDLKMRQYEVGKRFCDAVVARGGIDALNRAWASPDQLPSLAELDDPAGWMRRTQVRLITKSTG